MSFVVIFTTYFAYLLNTYALQTLSASVVSAYIYLQPLLAAAIALLLGSDHIDLLKVVSAIMIFAGVYIAGRSAATGNQINQQGDNHKKE